MPRKRVKSTLTRAEIIAKRKAGFQKSVRADIAKVPSDREKRWWGK